MVLVTGIGISILLFDTKWQSCRLFHQRVESAYSSVTHPSEAEATFLMYLNRVPLVAAGGGGTQSCRRLSISVCKKKKH